MAPSFLHDQSFRLAITEVTGRCRGTGGDVHIVDYPDGSTTLVFRLTD